MGRGFGSLDGDLCVALAVILHHGVKAVLGYDVFEILILIGGVDAEEIMIVGDLVHQDIVDEAAVFVEQAGVVGLAEFQLVYGVGGDVVGELGGFRTANLDLAHVADIEDAHRVAHRVVLVDDSAILDGHVPPAEIHHLRTQGAMDRVQGCNAESRHCWHENSG